MDGMMNEATVEEIQYIVIRIGDEQYGINIGYVDNIVRMQSRPFPQRYRAVPCHDDEAGGSGRRVNVKCQTTRKELYLPC